MKLYFKLTIFVVLLFAAVIATCLLWKPLKVRYYAAKLHSENKETRQNAARILLNLATEGPKDRGTSRPVFKYYTDRYNSKDVKERMEVVDELCACGDKGKAVMKEIFVNWCKSPSQQVKIPAGALPLQNGNKVKIKSLWVDKYEVTWEKMYVYAKFNQYTCLAPRNDSERAQLKKQLDKALEMFMDMDNKTNLPQCYNTLNLPISYIITWRAAKAYADWLGMRLPTGEEWEYAARAGSTGKYCFGDNKSLLGEYAWFRKNSGGKPHPVGKKKPNRWGLYDVHGNICELTEKAAKYPDSIVALGGYFSYEDWSCTFEWHWGAGRHMTNFSTEFTGFRCVRDP